MPNKTFISKSTKSNSSLKTAKKRVILVVCSNASGDFSIKLEKAISSFYENSKQGQPSSVLRANNKALDTSFFL